MALFRQRLKSQFSMEDANPRVIEAEPAAAVARVNQLKKETDESIVEVVRVAQEGELLTEEMEVLTDEHQGLDRVRETLESFRSEGGMNPQAAAVLQAAMEGFRIRLGITASIPSTESFGSSTDRMAMTEISIESISDMAKKIWEAIKKAWNKVIDWIKGLFSKKKESAGKLKERFKELKDAKPEGKVPSDAGMEFNSVKDVFFTDKLIENATNVISLVENNLKFGQILLKYNDELPKKASELEALKNKTVDGAKDENGKAITKTAKDKASKELTKFFEDFNGRTIFGSAPTVSGKSIPEGKGAEGFTYGEAPIGYLFGGDLVYVGTKKTEDGKDEDFDAVVISPEERKGKDGKLGFPEWGAIAASSKSCYDYLDKYVDNNFDKIAETLEKVMASNPKEGNVEDVKVAAKAVQKYMTTIAGKVDSLVLSGLSKVADYYEACKDAHKKD